MERFAASSNHLSRKHIQGSCLALKAPCRRQALRSVPQADQRFAGLTNTRGEAGRAKTRGTASTHARACTLLVLVLVVAVIDPKGGPAIASEL